MNKRITLTIALLSLMAAGPAAATGDAAAGKAKAEAICKGCHGADGNSTNPQYPRLAGQYASYIRKALHDYQSGRRKNPIMKGFAASLSDQDIDNLAAYFSTQKGLHTPVLPRRVDQ